jgi:hypothetical protein
MSDALTIRRYGTGDAAVWNRFVAQSRNGTFLLDRGFMEYHAHLFEDHSMIIERGGKVLALLPANLAKKAAGDQCPAHQLHSHGGLTYGGLIYGTAMSAALMVEIIAALRQSLRTLGISEVLYKPVPHIFHQAASEEDLYALLQDGARLVRTDLSSALAIGGPVAFSKSKRQGARRAEKAGLSIHRSEDFAAFWQILTARLGEAHDAAPTHSLAEIELLKGRFDAEIQLFVAQGDGGVQGGLVVFDCGQVVHVQYMATTEAGRTNAALDLIIERLVTEIYADRAWLNFGISTTDAGRNLNVGLSRQKEMFGARGILFQHYAWDLT